MSAARSGSSLAGSTWPCRANEGAVGWRPSTSTSRLDRAHSFEAEADSSREPDPRGVPDPYDRSMVQVARQGATLLAVAALAVVGACSDRGGDPGPGPAPTTTPSPTEPALPPSDGTGSVECGDSALLRAPGEALGVFPDDDVEWTARPADAVLGDLILVSLTPSSDTVGYPEFRFVYRCDAGGPARIASYALDEGRFVLLSTSDALADEQLPAELEWVGPEQEG